VDRGARGGKLNADTDLPAWCTVGARVAMHYQGGGAARGDHVAFGTVRRLTATLVIVEADKMQTERRFQRATLRERGESSGWGGWTVVADPAAPAVVAAVRVQEIAKVVYWLRDKMNNTRFPDRDLNNVHRTIWALRESCNDALIALANMEGWPDEAQ
jgi:hypothetical protein